jgi:FkbM family methyltransferase
VDGLRIEVPRSRLWTFRTRTYYERNVVKWFVRTLRGQRDPVVYDLGSNVGYYALRAASLANAVYAFEPASATFEVLERNIARNGFANVRPFRLAVVDQDEELMINLYETSGNNSVVDRRLEHLSRVGRESVRGVALDHLIASEGLKPPSLIKLDVEGSELAALRGAREIIRHARPVIFIEWWEEGARDAGYSLDELALELSSHGYNLAGLTGNPMEQPLDDLSDPRVGMVLATP